jgi:hypothetical protein
MALTSISKSQTTATEPFVSLSCPNCGGKLEVYDEMDRFACGYCKSEILAVRRGGTVSLKAVTETIKKIQFGTDKTAAELALPRLEIEQEIAVLSARMQFAQKYSAAKGWNFGGLKVEQMLEIRNQEGWRAPALQAANA